MADSKIEVLSERIEHHVGEEQPSIGIFFQARAAGLAMDALGARPATHEKALSSQFATAGLPGTEIPSFAGAGMDGRAPVGEAH